MSYIENPKVKGSGIVCAIPQTGRCPIGCPDCFFQSGRSYLEPLDKHLPNMPSAAQARGRVVRVNDGNDSHNQQDLVIKMTQYYDDMFYNTSIPLDLDKYPGPVVLTVNPGKLTDTFQWHLVGCREMKYLMAVRFRVNTWNVEEAKKAVEYYAAHDVPTFLTFMAYHSAESIPGWALRTNCYEHRKRTTNHYYAITKFGIDLIMDRINNGCAYICGELQNNKCKYCGNCLREYFAWKEKWCCG